MRVEVSLYCAGSIIKEIVNVERFEDAQQIDGGAGCTVIWLK